MINYVIDTNIFILLFNQQLGEPIPKGHLGFSVITEIELLSFSELTEGEEKLIREHLRFMERIALDEAVSQQAIALRRKNRLKTPDAIVAASAIVTDTTLLTNDQQLLNVAELRTRALKTSV